MEHYAAIKERLVAASDVAIIGTDDDYCAAIASGLQAKAEEGDADRVKLQACRRRLARRAQLVSGNGRIVQTVADLSTGTGRCAANTMARTPRRHLPPAAPQD